MPKYMETSERMPDEITKTNLEIAGITEHAVNADKLHKSMDTIIEDPKNNINDPDQELQGQIGAQLANAGSGSSSSAAATSRRDPLASHNLYSNIKNTFW